MTSVASRARFSHPAVAIALLALLFVVARVLWIDVDPPRFLGELSLREVVTEPIAKASEARNHALFGKWTPNLADEYGFWRPQSPVWVYPLAGFLKVFGVGLVQLRAFAVVYTLLGFVALLMIARQKLRGVEFWAAGAFVALDALYVTYSRSGLLEPAVSTWGALVVLCLLLARRHWAWQLGAHWAFVLAFFTKGAAVYLLPVLGGTTLWLLWRMPGTADRARARAAVIGHGLVLAGLALLYVRTDFYMRTLLWNLNHMVVNETHGGSLRVDAFSWGEFLGAIVNPAKFERYGLILGVAGPLALFELGAVAVALVRRRRIDAFRVIVSGWFLSALTTLFLVETVELRFGSILPMPAALAAASGLRTISRLRPRRQRAWRMAVPAVALAAFAVFNGYLYARLYEKRPREVLAGSRILVETIGQRRAAIVGFSSAPAVFSTPYEHYYVKHSFNASRATLDKLGITHLLLSRDRHVRDDTRVILNKRYQGALKRLPRLARFEMLSAELTLFAVPGSLAELADASRSASRPDAE